jgi:beta-N-acetylhexosaminidase
MKPGLRKAGHGVTSSRQRQAGQHFPRLLFAAIVLLSWLGTLIGPITQAAAQTPTPDSQAQQLLRRMSPAERLGQLFLVTFNGTDTTSTSQVWDLIVNYHVGGVILSAANDNFTAAPDSVTNARDLVENLQRITWDHSLGSTTDPATGELRQLNYVPLWLGLSQAGNGYPSDQILSGLTPLPSEMAIGATWNPTMANQAGQVMGEELSALGINMYLGPSLDVLETPSSTASGDLGTRTFGGDPFWVGEMGTAYIAGLHTGSGERMAVIARNFPGRGGSDRSTEEEVPTIRKSLEQLKQIELAPFFNVTGAAPTPESTADGLLVSHIRYQGLQGNIRATTRPVSFDSQALMQILTLPEFTAWREAGGLLVSDDLSTRAVREFYGEPFIQRNAARDAFLAGNDLLYLGQNSSLDVPGNYAAVVQTLQFFTQKYGEDPVFAQLVDAAVLRILTAKYRMYGEFAFPTLLAARGSLADVGKSVGLVFDIARRAATLISPEPQELTTVLPGPPRAQERLVFLTDTGFSKQCSTCADEPGLAADALEQAVIRLYGPQGGNQTSTFRAASYSLDHLRQFLEGAPPQFMDQDLARADWVVISLADPNPSQVDIVKRFLSGRQDLLRDRRVVLFSFGAPYYMDATDISKLTAYYALYSKQPPFVDVAARLLFEELTPTGRSPVSISGVGYDLITAMMPDPDQIITLSLDLPIQASGTGTPAGTPVPLFRIGDTIAIRTGVIRDHNGHAVPDGTVVRFSMLLTGEGGGILQQVAEVTDKGIARASFGLDKPGLLEIKAASDPAVVSEALRMDVSLAGGAAVTVIVPVLTGTVVTAVPATPTPEPDPFLSRQGHPTFNAWLLNLLLLVGGAALAYWVASRIKGGREGVRWSLCVLLGGLVAYNYIALSMPGAESWTTSQGMFGILVFTMGGQVLGALAAALWGRRSSASRSQSG